MNASNKQKLYYIYTSCRQIQDFLDYYGINSPERLNEDRRWLNTVCFHISQIKWELDRLPEDIKKAIRLEVGAEAVEEIADIASAFSEDAVKRINVRDMYKLATEKIPKLRNVANELIDKVGYDSILKRRDEHEQY